MHLNVEFWGRPDSTVMSVGPQSAARLLTDIKFFSHLLCTACRWASSFRRHCRLTRGSEPICAVQQKKRKRKKRDMVSVITTRPPWNRERRRRPHQPLVELQLLVAFQRQTGDPLRVELVRQQRLRQRPEEAFQAVLASETKRTTKQFLIGRRSTMDQSGALTVTSCSE